VLIVYEGPEGAGKSTQLRLLSEWLVSRGREVIAVREPGGTILGDEIRRILLDPGSDIVPAAEALLFMASRAQLVERVLRPAVGEGSIVLLDRFFLSTYAYQGAGRGISDDDLAAANRMATRGLTPDLTILLDLPTDEGFRRVSRRGAHDRMERAATEFHARRRGVPAICHAGVAAASSGVRPDCCGRCPRDSGPSIRARAHGAPRPLARFFPSRDLARSSRAIVRVKRG
jgi:dTMP kinase